MKPIITILICFIFLNTSAQQAKFDGKNWNAPYNLPMPEGWEVERFPIPIEFASSIPYKGVEDIRFTPGWSKQASDEYWSYAFLWYLDSTVKFDAKTIEKNLTAYYTGLININIDSAKVKDLPPVKLSVKEIKATSGEAKAFEGTVSMLDFLTQKPIVLNLAIHIKYCEDQNKTFAFHELSPQSFNHAVWKSLNQLWTNFKCSK